MTLNPQNLAALLAAQGIVSTPQTVQSSTIFATLVLGNSAQAFKHLEFEAEPSAYTTALRKAAP